MRGASAVLIALAVAGCSLGGEDGEAGSAVEGADYVAEIARPFFEDEDPVGTVGLSSEGPRKTRIIVELDDPPEPRMRTELRRGGCMSSIGPADYVLNDLEGGSSETVVEVPLADLRRLYMVFIRRLGTESLDGLCGDIFDAEEN